MNFYFLSITLVLALSIPLLILLATGKTVNQKVIIATKDGTTIAIELFSSPNIGTLAANFFFWTLPISHATEMLLKLEIKCQTL